MILFICHGNVARSQFAEALSKNRGIKNVISAGICVNKEKEGINLNDDGETAKKAVNYFKIVTGIDISKYKRKLITPGMAENSDMIISMIGKDILPAYLSKYFNKITFWEVDDPHDYDFDGYKKVIKTIQEYLDHLEKIQL